MISVTIVVVGKFKGGGLATAAAEYEKRLGPYVRISTHEVKPEPFKSDAQKVNALQAEGERLLAYLEKQKNSLVLLLDKGGKDYDSLSLSKYLDGLSQPLFLVIGGTQGFSPAVLAKGYGRISLSKLTFTHEMARLILVEQLYRSITIIKGIKYHY